MTLISTFFSTELKNVKKVIDDKDRARKASVLNEVAETTKVILTANPSIPFLVLELNAYAQNKALDGALKQVRNFFHSVQSNACSCLQLNVSKAPNNCNSKLWQQLLQMYYTCQLQYTKVLLWSKSICL